MQANRPTVYLYAGTTLLPVAPGSPTCPYLSRATAVSRKVRQGVFFLGMDGCYHTQMVKYGPMAWLSWNRVQAMLNAEDGMGSGNCSGGGRLRVSWV